jgi:hypothetical protein
MGGWPAAPTDGVVVVADAGGSARAAGVVASVADGAGGRAATGAAGAAVGVGAEEGAEAEDADAPPPSSPGRRIVAIGSPIGALPPSGSTIRPTRPL